MIPVGGKQQEFGPRKRVDSWGTHCGQFQHIRTSVSSSKTQVLFARLILLCAKFVWIIAFYSFPDCFLSFFLFKTQRLIPF